MDKESHHLWSAEKDDRGLPVIRRKKLEKEIPSGEEEMEKQKMKDVCAAYWGLFGASLVDDVTMNNRIPSDIVNRFNVSFTASADASPRIYEWRELTSAFGDDMVNEIRSNISDGMKIRVASKKYNIPFLLAADIVDDLDSVSTRVGKNIIDLVKEGRSDEAIRNFGRVAGVIAKSYREYSSVMPKIAIDQKAKEYWESYYGPFGKELVREVKKRVRADMFSAWMRKNGVDSSAAEYWSKYFGEYGKDWVKVIPKRISPSKK